MKPNKVVDPFLEKYREKYDRWLKEGKIDYSSKVIPVAESLNAQQWVLPQAQVMGILKDAQSVAVADCTCRSHYKRCDKPLTVCFYLNAMADTKVAEGKARFLDLAEAAGVLSQADAAGLVHMSLYMPNREIFALCSCCPCCCHDLQLVNRYGRQDLMVHSEYVAETNAQMCMDCGDCVDRCAFDARKMKDDVMVYDATACVGCGLCVSVCPAEATSMVLHKADGLE